jgi:GDP-L-fucose synthase
MSLTNKRILITGGESMLGIAVSNELKKYNCIVDQVPHTECDLLDFGQVYDRMIHFNPDYVIHLATYSGNIQFNQKYPADTFYKTGQIGLNVLRSCAKLKVNKVLSIISSCAVAESGDELREEDLHKGRPNPSIESHGYAKRILDIYSRMLHKQYGLNAICAIVNNSFGEYDSFSPEKTKVIGAMIKRFVDAKEQKLPFVECWGTGVAKREFIYAGDVAKLLLLILEKYTDNMTPINIGSPNEITIKELAETTANLVGYKGEIRWLKEKGDGQLRKKLELSKLNSLLDRSFTYTPFKIALAKTIEWYYKNREMWIK